MCIDFMRKENSQKNLKFTQQWESEEEKVKWLGH